MSNQIEKMNTGPILILVIVGIVLSSILFHFMFKYAEEGNLMMVIAIPLLVSIIAFAIARSLVPRKKE